MCDKRNSVIAKIHGGDIRLDPCLREQIIKLNYIAPFTVASCCGHYRYPETILVMYDLGTVREIRSGVIIPRKRRFYKIDTYGYYYIPELMAKPRPMEAMVRA